MTEMLERNLPGRLERSCISRGSCGANADRVRIGSGAVGIERLAAHFHGQAFSPHRHDSYAIGITISGVQAFRYRGEQRYCLPGQCHILHPDELHDGAAGTEEGFSYRILYLDPSLVQQALGGGALPFVGDPVIETNLLPPELVAAIIDIDDEMDALDVVELSAIAADTLAVVAGCCMPKEASHDIAALALVRDAIAARPEQRHSLEELERLAGLDRWALARRFRRAFGTSPVRFRTMRRLDRVRREMRAGVSPVEAALAAGFADQSHMTRHFKRTYGLTPARWAAIVA